MIGLIVFLTCLGIATLAFLVLAGMKVRNWIREREWVRLAFFGWMAALCLSAALMILNI